MGVEPNVYASLGSDIFRSSFQTLEGHESYPGVEEGDDLRGYSPKQFWERHSDFLDVPKISIRIPWIP